MIMLRVRECIYMNLEQGEGVIISHDNAELDSIICQDQKLDRSSLTNRWRTLSSILRHADCLLGCLFFSFLFFKWLYLQRMEDPRIGVKSELQLPAYTTATATPDLEPHLRPAPLFTATPDP